MFAIVGSKGFIGQEFVKFLKREGVSFKEYSSKLGNLIDSNNKLVKSFELPEGCETVVFLSQSPYYRNFPEKYEELIAVNSVLPFSVAKKAIEKKVKRFIYFSTGSVYKPAAHALSENAELNRGAHYPLSKILGEENLQLLKDKIEICCVRPFSIFGTGQENMLIPNLIKGINSAAPVYLDALSEEKEFDGLKISLMHISDAVKATYAISTSSKLPPFINLSSGEAMTIKEIADSIGEALGKEPNFVHKEIARAGNLIADTSLITFTYSCQSNLREEIMKMALEIKETGQI